MAEGGNISTGHVVKSQGGKKAHVWWYFYCAELTTLMLRTDRATAVPLGSLMKSTNNAQGLIRRDRLWKQK